MENLTEEEIINKILELAEKLNLDSMIVRDIDLNLDSILLGTPEFLESIINSAKDSGNIVDIVSIDEDDGLN